MFKIDKQEEPQFFKDYKKKNKITNWNDIDYEIKAELKKYMFENEQKYNCPYCELKIGLENSQIEHIKPKDKFPKELKEYSNYLVGCTNKKTCGQSKGNRWSENFINPTIENPSDYLTYDIMSGKIIPTSEDDKVLKKANETIEILNLNDKRLCEMRKTFIINNLQNLEYIDYYEEFPTLSEFLKNNYK